MARTKQTARKSIFYFLPYRSIGRNLTAWL